MSNGSPDEGAFTGDPGGSRLSPDEYCRAVEAYLCRKNGGHLVRIVGPAFDCVRGWAGQGIPLKIAMQGIDRCVERHEAKGGRRRPVRVEFCDGDVLASFDAWRRAIGVPRDSDAREADNAPAIDLRKSGSLRTHLDRVIARLTVLRGGASPVDDVLDAIVRELDTLRPTEGTLRGAARAAVEARLRTLDARLLEDARQRCDAVLPDLTREAGEELSPYRERLSRDDYAKALDATVDRLVRARLSLPVVSYDGW